MVQIDAISERVINKERASSALRLARYSLKIPKNPPHSYPIIIKMPLVIAGAMGKVNSAPIPMDAGMIGTRNVPSKTHVIIINQKLPSGRMKMKATSIAKTPQQITRNVIR